MVNNHVYLDVLLDGRGPYHFVFDSGGGNLMDPGVAAELGLNVTGRGRIGGVGDATEPAGTAALPSLRVGDLTLSGERFTVARTRASFGAAEGPRIDGLIGAQILARYVVTIDYAARTLHLTAPGPDGTSPPPGTTLPVTFHGGLPQIPCTITGVTGSCTVDTGSRLSLTVPAPFASAHPSLVPPVLSAPGIDGYGVGGAARGRLGRVADVRFGDLDIRDVVADFSTQERGAFADRAVAANVGGAIWRRFTLTFDYPHRRLTLQPNADFDAPDVYDRSGLFLIVRDGGIAVLGVRAGTPAAQAGIGENESIVAVDGRPVAAADLVDVRALLSGPPGTVVRLRAAGDGAQREVSLTLRDYV